MSKSELIIYNDPGNPDFQIEVRIEKDTVWLNRQQIALLFNRDIKTIGKHINNAFNEELSNVSVVAKFATTATDGKVYQTEHYNLDMIISVGYRVKSKRGVQFRIWANSVLKDYLLKGYAVSNRVSKIEDDVFSLKTKVNEFEFQLRSSLPPTEGIYYDGQIFDAWQFVSKLIKSAKKEIVLIDNYVDESVLVLLLKRGEGVTATIYTTKISKQLMLDLEKHNTQYPKIEIKVFKQSHDRFLIIDNKTVYHIGASLKDLGKKWFAFSKIGIDAREMVHRLE